MNYKKIKVKQENETMYVLGLLNSCKDEEESYTSIQRFDKVNGKCPVKIIKFDEKHAYFEILVDCNAKYGNARNIMLKKNEKIMVDLNGDIFKVIL